MRTRTVLSSTLPLPAGIRPSPAGASCPSCWGIRPSLLGRAPPSPAQVLPGGTEPSLTSGTMTRKQALVSFPSVSDPASLPSMPMPGLAQLSTDASVTILCGERACGGTLLMVRTPCTPAPWLLPPSPNWHARHSSPQVTSTVWPPRDPVAPAAVHTLVSCPLQAGSHSPALSHGPPEAWSQQLVTPANSCGALETRAHARV